MAKRILVVDDSRLVVEMLKAQLEEGGYEVITASDGVEGVAKADRELPDLVLLDLVMPKQDGFATLRALRRQDSTAHLPVVILSAKGETDFIIKGQELGAADYVIKGCEASELLACIERYI